MIRRLLDEEAAFDALLLPLRRQADQVMLAMNAFLMVVCLGLAPWRDTWIDALVVGASTLGLAAWLTLHRPGRLVTRLFMASAFMLYTGLIIHQSGGMTEGHFAAFGLIGVLLYYRDWRTIVVATAVIYLHHLLLGWAQVHGAPVFVFDSGRYWLKFGVHVAYFLPFVAMMALLSVWLRRDAAQSLRVIELADRIARGQLFEQVEIGHDDARSPLLQAVLGMKSLLLDLVRLSPLATAVVRLDDGRLMGANDAWQQGFGDASSQPGLAFDALPMWPQPQPWPVLLHELQTHAGAQDKKPLSCPLLDKRAQEIQAEVSIVVHHDARPPVAIVTAEDVSLRKAAERRMQRLAFRDRLTDLPNRASFEDDLYHAITAWRQFGRPFALALLDLDRFKEVNDSHGHAAGDIVLKTVAQRLAHALRDSDMCARLGGDEFAVVLHGCGDPDQARHRIEGLVEAIQRPIELHQGRIVVSVGASAGLTVSVQAYPDAEALMQEADAAMYRAKRAGKGSSVVSAVGLAAEASQA